MSPESAGGLGSWLVSELPDFRNQCWPEHHPMVCCIGKVSLGGRPKMAVPAALQVAPTPRSGCYLAERFPIAAKLPDVSILTHSSKSMPCSGQFC